MSAKLNHDLPFVGSAENTGPGSAKYQQGKEDLLELLVPTQRRADQATLLLMKAGRFVVANKQNVKLAFDQFVNNFDTVVFPNGSKFTRYGDAEGVGEIVSELIADFQRVLNWDISGFPPARTILANLFWEGVNGGWYPERDAESEDFQRVQERGL